MKNPHSQFYKYINQPRSQGLSSYRPLEQARRDPGRVWSRATWTVENISEGSFVISNLSRSALLSSKDRAATAITRGILKIISLLAEISNNICSNDASRQFKQFSYDLMWS